MSGRTVESELASFENFFEHKAPRLFETTKLADHAFKIAPKNLVASIPGKQLGLVIMALTHGNEVGGLGVLNDLLDLLDARPELLTIPLGLVLGNPWAARRGQRFIDRDLNRSFARQESQVLEDKRARVLEPILSEAAYFLDIHQTTEPAEAPFFIFPYTARTFRFARAIAPTLPIVTHWGDPFSAEGRCSDEFVILRGGTAITMELGQSGFHPYQIACGYHAALHALIAATDALVGKEWPEPRTQANIFTWAKIYPWPEGTVALDQGWTNFKQVAVGQRLGEINGQAFFSEFEGNVLFPKYQRGPELQKPTELICIMRRIREDDLGT